MIVRLTVFTLLISIVCGQSDWTEEPSTTTEGQWTDEQTTSTTEELPTMTWTTEQMTTATETDTTETTWTMTEEQTSAITTPPPTYATEQTITEETATTGYRTTAQGGWTRKFPLVDLSLAYQNLRVAVLIKIQLLQLLPLGQPVAKVDKSLVDITNLLAETIQRIGTELWTEGAATDAYVVDEIFSTMLATFSPAYEALRSATVSLNNAVKQQVPLFGALIAGANTPLINSADNIAKFITVILTELSAGVTVGPVQDPDDNICAAFAQFLQVQQGLRPALDAKRFPLLQIPVVGDSVVVTLEGLVGLIGNVMNTTTINAKQLFGCANVQP